jgi:hypothetical protein
MRGGSPTTPSVVSPPPQALLPLCSVQMWAAPLEGVGGGGGGPLLDKWPADVKGEHADNCDVFEYGVVALRRIGASQRAVVQSTPANPCAKSALALPFWVCWRMRALQYAWRRPILLYVALKATR